MLAFGDTLGTWVFPGKVAEILALPQNNRALLAHELIASLEDTIDPGVKTEWNDVIHRRSREIEEGKVSCRPVEEVIQEIRKKLYLRRLIAFAPKTPPGVTQH